MRFLFDLGHPAHFHLFKNVISALKDDGHRVLIVARQKDCLPELLTRSGWPHLFIRRKRRRLVSLATEAVKVFGRVSFSGLVKPVDLMVGTSIVIGPASRLTGATSVVFSEDDASVVPMFAKLAYSAAHYIVTPRSLEHEAHGLKHLTYQGYHELAYLHPDVYRPDPGVRELLGVAPGEKYFVLRLVALTAHHDIGQKGVNPAQAQAVVQHLLPHGRVFISAEADVPDNLKQYRLTTPADRILDVMAFADMVVGDSQTMTIEAAVLGTPSLRCNTFVGRLSVLEELEHRYGLTVGIRPENFDRVLEQIDSWLAQPGLKKQWARKRQVMLDECVNLTEWMHKLFDRLAHHKTIRAGGVFRPLRVRRWKRPASAVVENPMETYGPLERDRPLQDKYAIREPVSRLLVRKFFKSLQEMLNIADGRILDVGAGEGDAYQFLSPEITTRGVTAMEINPACFIRMAKIAPSLTPVEGTIYEIPFEDGSFETVLCSEVLEHLEDPTRGLRELLRVSGRWVLISVPREPIWRIMNVARGAYWRTLGNTPGHIRHWSKRGFIRWVEQFADVKAVRSPLPWTIVLASPR
ncbi:MAG: methyltransferase domain-containing protein [Planctomycetota bacterium]|nr:methyltransferase domain-containing protein [Planctomycetota bacterium]